MHLGLFCIRHWLVVYSHPSAFRFRVLMHLGLCYSRHELLAYTHPSAFGVRLLMHVWRLRAARILTPQCVRIASAPYCSCMCGSYMPLGEKPLGQDCGSHAPRTLQDCGFSCPWSSSKDNVPRASKQTSHFRAAPEMLGVVLYQSRASGVHPPLLLCFVAGSLLLCLFLLLQHQCQTSAGIQSNPKANHILHW